MINDILTAIAERLGDTEPNLKYIDEDWGQLDYYHEHPPVKFPCVLLELQQASWKNQGKLVQDGIIDITVRVCDIKLSNTSFKAPQQQKTNAAAIWLILENIHKALHGWRPADQSEFNTLTRISSRRVKRDDGIREFEVVYSCMAIDKSATVKYYNIADPAIAADQFDTIPPIPEVEPILLINPQNLDDMALPGIVINITQSKGAAAIAPIPQTVFNLLVADDPEFSFIIRAAEGNILKIHWGDGSTEDIAFSGEFQTITKTYAEAGNYDVMFQGDLTKIEYVAANQMPMLIGYMSESLTLIQQLHICCCSLAQQDVDTILTAFTDDTKYPELTYLDLSGQMPTAHPTYPIMAAFLAARPLVNLTVDIPVAFTLVAPTDEYVISPINLILGTPHLYLNTGDVTIDWTEGTQGPLPMGVNELPFTYATAGSKDVRLTGDTDIISQIILSTTDAPNPIVAINPDYFPGLNTFVCSGSDLSSETLVALLTKLILSGNFPGLMYIDLSFQSTGGGISEEFYVLLAEAFPGTFNVDII